MKRLTILAIIACVGLLVGSAAVVGGPGGPPGGMDVSVVNEPNVNAYQAGEWSVNIGSSTKTMKRFFSPFPADSTWVQVCQVPSGKRLVLTDIFFNQTAAGDNNNAILLRRNFDADECNVASEDHFLQINLSGPDGSDNYRIFLPLQTGYEFEAGERICLSSSGGGNIFYNLSGYETDL